MSTNLGYLLPEHGTVFRKRRACSIGARDLGSCSLFCSLTHSGKLNSQSNFWRYDCSNAMIAVSYVQA